MDSGIGIGGLSTGKDETASSQFDLFENVELETGVKKIHTQTFRPISSTNSQGPRVLVKLANYSEKTIKLQSGTPVGYVVLTPYSLEK